MAQITFTNTGGITATGAIRGNDVYSNGSLCLTAAITSLATGSSGSGNVVTDITVSGNTITKVKGITALTGITKNQVTSALGYTPPTTNTTYGNFVAATTTKAGSAGLVPAPTTGDTAKYLANGGWTSLPSASSTRAGIIPAGTGNNNKTLVTDASGTPTWGVATEFSATNGTTTGARYLYFSYGTSTGSSEYTPASATGISKGRAAINDNIKFEPSQGRLQANSLTLTSTNDASLTGVNNVALIVGPTTGTHIEMDNNEIMCKSGATGSYNLYLNLDGGRVIAGTDGLETRGNLYFTSGAAYVAYNSENKSIEFCI